MKCEIIRDLLPSYVDELTSVESNEAIQEHMEQCEECREILMEMQKEISSGRKKSEEDRDIQPFIKVKRETARKMFIAVILTVFVCVIVIEYYKGYFYHGKSVLSEEVTISYEADDSIKSLCFEPVDEDVVVYIGYAENKPINGQMPLETISLIKYKNNSLLNSPNENQYRMRFIDENTVLYLYSYPGETDFTEEDFIAIEFTDEVKLIKMSELRDGNIESLK